MKKHLVTFVEDAGKTVAAVVPLLIMIEFWSPGGLEALSFAPTTAAFLYGLLAILAWGFFAAICRSIYKGIKKASIPDSDKV